LDAFAFQRYGAQFGTITSIARTLLRPDRLNAGVQPPIVPAYRATAALRAQSLTAYSRTIPLQADMQLRADIALSEQEPGLDRPQGYERTLRGEIEVRGLSFRCSDDEPFIFENLNFRVAAGEHVAISGPSGCGKTTVLKMLIGLVKPTSGEVLLGGMPLAALGPGVFRSQIGVVMQEDHLLSGSIADNIRCFDEASDL
jgi:ABC-type bacteriocin/lantibiotic exporter with double-glycine peptidase domain